ncbi:GreA/GreB family elongation factor [Apibacter raozihei]|uniref:GreA/GreB family elongation factor n=1 Tax=Apibacter TaxID=1778601 RepID=UPI001E432988|nr:MULTISPECIES: GreA/GreB family elongation factor [Apibacter]
MINKQEIISLLKDIIDNKVIKFQKLIFETRESNTDTKSSMGDKYETSREMLQQEINLLQKQLSEVLGQQEIIRKLTDATNSKVSLGALVYTSLGLFYISCGIGVFEMRDKRIIGISITSPLAKAMLGKIKNDTFVLNNKSEVIIDIY